MSIKFISVCKKHHVVGYGELNGNEMYAFAMMDTRKGQPQATGIMPSLLVLDYHVTSNKLEGNTCMLLII